MADATKFDPVPVTGLETLRRPDPLAGLPPAPPLDPPAAGPKPADQAPEPAKPTAAPPLPSNTAWVREALGRLKPTGRRGLLALVGAASLGAGAAAVKFVGPKPPARPDVARAVAPAADEYDWDEFDGPPLPPEPAEQKRAVVEPPTLFKLDPPAALPPVDLKLPPFDPTASGGPSPGADKPTGPVPLKLPGIPDGTRKLDPPDPTKLDLPPQPKPAEIPTPDLRGLGKPNPSAAYAKPAPKPADTLKPDQSLIQQTRGGDPVPPSPGVKPADTFTPIELPKLDTPPAPVKLPEPPKLDLPAVAPPGGEKKPEPAAPAAKPEPGKAEPTKFELPPLPTPGKTPEPAKVELPPLGPPPAAKPPEPAKAVELPKLDLSPTTPGPAAPPPTPAPSPTLPTLDFGPPVKPAPVSDVTIQPAAAPKLLELTPTRPLPPASGRAAAAAAAFDVDLVYPKPGDSYTAVSRRALGDDRYAAALEAHNRFARVDDLAAERRPVEVPPVAVLRKQYGAYLTRQPADAAVTPAGRSEPRPAGDGRKVYVVPAGGRTLKQLAAAAFGDENFWGRVYDENRGLAPDQPVPAGTRVRLPADARIGE